MKNRFKKEIHEGFLCNTMRSKDLITESDLEHLPAIVQKYLKYVGVVGKERVHNLKISFEGKIRSNPTDGWMKLTAHQFSFFENPTRLFFLKAFKMGIPAIGLHVYKNEKASMLVKLLGLFKVVDVQGEKMNHAETVTHFNDMCLMAPATLIGKNIRWEEIDSTTVKAWYTNQSITISAELYFNQNGELANFISNDRYDLSNPKSPKLYPFSTPIVSYKEYNGFRLASNAKTIYHRPDGDFCYGEFILQSIEYNCNEQKDLNPSNIHS